MKKFFTLLVFCAVLQPILAQTVLFTETFDEANGATSGTSAEGISWSAVCPACLSGDYYQVVDGAFEGKIPTGPLFGLRAILPFRQEHNL
ncbi:MAG: hypothetical protein R2798_13240 [Chitinophagales bacterium]